MQVSKHPAFQMILLSSFSRGFTIVTTQTQSLDVVQIVRHREVGKAVDGFDMICVRSFGGDRNCASTAMKAVADQSLPLEVSATGPVTLMVDESRLPFIVFRVLVTAGLIRFR